MFAALLLTAALAGQAATPTRFAWEFDETHLGATMAIETSGEVVPCVDVVMTPTVDSQCTAAFVREVAQTVRLRVSRDGSSAYSDPITVPPASEGGPRPGVITVTFVGEAPAMVSTTTSRRFDAPSGTQILSNTAGAGAGNNVGGQANWTLAAWVKIAAEGDGGTVAGIWAANNHQTMLVVNADGSVSGHVHGNFFWEVRSPPGVIIPDRWYLLALRHVGNGFSGAVSLWINDALVADAATTGTAPVGVVPFTIGAHGASGEVLLPFHGWLSSIGVWRGTGVSDQDLRSLRGRYPSAPPAGLTFLTITTRDEILDYAGTMLLTNVGTAFSADGPSGLQP